MPRKYKKRKGNKSNFNKRTGPGLGKLVPLPPKWRFPTRYVTADLVIDPQTASNADHRFRLNSLFDVDFSGGGHQPLGYDQLMTMYTKVTVIGARARITMTNTDPHLAQNLVVFPTSTGTTISSDAQLQTMIERGRARWCQLAPAGSGGCTKTLTFNWSAREWYGKSPFDEDDFSHTTATNPVEVAYLHVVGQALNAGAENPSPLVGSLVLESTAILTDRS